MLKSNSIDLAKLSEKIPGWGIVKVHEIRKKENQVEALVECPAHEAPFWLDMEEVYRYKGRVIYQGKEANLNEQLGGEKQ